MEENESLYIFLSPNSFANDEFLSPQLLFFRKLRKWRPPAETLYIVSKHVQLTQFFCNNEYCCTITLIFEYKSAGTKVAGFFFSFGTSEIIPGFVGLCVAKFLVFYVMQTAVCLLIGYRFFTMAVWVCFRPLSLIVPLVSFVSLLHLLAKEQTRTVHGGIFVQLKIMLPIYICGSRVIGVNQICTYFQRIVQHVFSCMAQQRSKSGRMWSRRDRVLVELVWDRINIQVAVIWK